jgi:hypothetical protein
MKRGDSATFTTIRTEGALLPSDLLSRIAAGDPRLDETNDESYGLARREKIGETISRSWSRLCSAWERFRDAIRSLPEEDSGTTYTRDRWTLPLFQELGYGRLAPQRAPEIEGKVYPISHTWRTTPIHLMGCRIDLDRRTPGVAGAARGSPHGMVQDFLNRSAEHLWGFVSNGRVLRVLRDSSSLSRQAFVEFDLEAMLEGQMYADFVVLWRLCHCSRVDAESPEDCRLECWSQTAQAEGTRALDRLQTGVKSAIAALGEGFLQHSSNDALRRKLKDGSLTARDLYRQLLRLVYRIIFLLVAEDRELLLDPAAAGLSRDRYRRYYSLGRIRERAAVGRGTRHADVWRGLRATMRVLDKDGYSELALPALGSFLWSQEALRELVESDLTNASLFQAVRSLGFTDVQGRARRVDYKNLGPEEIGSVYESLLELHPEVNVDARTFSLTAAAGHARKATGSFYTPPQLIASVLDGALEPVIREAAGGSDPEVRLLAVRVCDPACGSGHFLLAAAHRIAKRLATLRSGDEEPSPDARLDALRDVVQRNIYGVDANELAVELCKVSLWIATLRPGTRLSFLDHRIVCGNSLIGATPALAASGLPDDAFFSVEGDDRRTAGSLRRQNRRSKKARQTGGDERMTVTNDQWRRFAARARRLSDAPDGRSVEPLERERQYADLLVSDEFLKERLRADAWCAAFVWAKSSMAPEAVTLETLLSLLKSPDLSKVAPCRQIAQLRSRYRFFHWHLAFPDVFQPADEGVERDSPTAGWCGGFDVIVGNPPWEKVELRIQEFFAARNPRVAKAPHRSARVSGVEELHEADPALHAELVDAKRTAADVQRFIHHSGRYPLTGHGHSSTAPLFVELALELVSHRGHIGMVVPTAIATDTATRHLFQELVEKRRLRSLYDFENRKPLFPGVHRSQKFSILHLVGRGGFVADPEFAFFLHDVGDLDDSERRFVLSSRELRQLCRNTGTCPVFRSRRDADIVRGIYGRVPILHADDSKGGENAWGIVFLPNYNVSSTDEAIRPWKREALEIDAWTLEGNRFRRGNDVRVPVYEAKMARMWDHRAADVIVSRTAVVRQAQPDPLSREDHEDPDRLPIPRFWAPSECVEKRYAGKWDRDWFLAWRDITSPTNQRTVVAMIIPRAAVSSTLRLLASKRTTPRQLAILLSNLNSLILDYCARQMIGGIHVTNTLLKQLPVLPPEAYLEPLGEEWFVPRVLELSCTSRDLAGFARDVGHDGPPFLWQSERRFQIRCELDAAFFRLYGIARNDVEYILEGFPILRKKDVKAFGDYRTKRVVLEIYDAMERASAVGEPYRSTLEPPPADARVAHPSKEARPASAAGRVDRISGALPIAPADRCGEEE